MTGKGDLAKRYMIFAAGMVLLALGITLTTKTLLGTSPISAIPYSLSMILPRLTLGNWTILFNALLILLEKILLKEKMSIMEMGLQFAMIFVFGYVIDGWMWLFSWLHPEAYGWKIVISLIGCVVVSVGVFLQFVGGTIMLPGDGFAKALAQALGWEFGTGRLVGDIVMSAIAIVLCLIFLHNLSGVREGTVLSALLVGNLVKLWQKLFYKKPTK